ncbi:MAG: L-seryl-tRNA(Sec) selenium transferase [Chitinivibrionales bacterium]|nr:L-seryl-tRNA(Sec) selenium transferase [Chitinivibrionales bacterium]
MKTNQSSFSQIPSVDSLLKHPLLSDLRNQYGHELAVYAIRQTLADARKSLKKSRKIPSPDDIAGKAKDLIVSIAKPSLKRVINATGVILHTNLGRAVLGDSILKEITPAIQGYSNLEFDLKTGQRGRRGDHIKNLLRFITGAEDACVVNNNAAALVLILHTFAAGKEVIVSRGELIEIGGSFRIPEIMQASGAIMKEVGTTNRTRLGDYARAITKNTAMLFKAHTSNFSIKGFAEDVAFGELSKLASKHKLISVYDVGSGLLRPIPALLQNNEPVVAQILADDFHSNADLICFSGDKLLGGPQAGIIAGRKKLIAQLEAAPLMRALRVDKITLAALSSVCRSFFSAQTLEQNNPTAAMLGRSKDFLKKLADELCAALISAQISCRVIESCGQCGGGTLPDYAIQSYAVELIAPADIRKDRVAFAENSYQKLLQAETPVLAILREGKILFDVLTIQNGEIEMIKNALFNKGNAPGLPNVPAPTI